MCSIISAAHAQIGFTEMGPIINFRIAITSDKDDSVIDLIEMDVKHESGSNHKFRWHEVSEDRGQMIFSGTPNQSITQFQESEAVAIKILQSDLKDIFLRNRMYEHTTKNNRFGYEFDKERRRLINNNQYVPEDFYITKTVQTFRHSCNPK